MTHLNWLVWAHINWVLLNIWSTLHYLDNTILIWDWLDERIHQYQLIGAQICRYVFMDIYIDRYINVSVHACKLMVTFHVCKRTKV